MMTKIEEHHELKSALLQLAEELVQKIQSIWSGDWSVKPPQVGTHYSYWDIKALPSFPLVAGMLGNVPGLEDKYQKSSIEKPIGAFLELTVGTLPAPALLEKVFEHWWKPFINFLVAENVPIQLYIGLLNFQTGKPEYNYDNEMDICFYNDRSLANEIEHVINAPLPEPVPSTGIPLHLIHGSVRVVFRAPAKQSVLEHRQYIDDCINRMIPIQESLFLSGFGRLIVGPWIPICNPEFPIDGVRGISYPESFPRLDEPLFFFGDPEWDRFKQIYPIVRDLRAKEDEEISEGQAIRRRILAAISRFTDTFSRGYWESVVVDLVIVMESLITPAQQGGRLPLALAASNLLGTTTQESKEVFENLLEMYKLRSQAVHGHPITQEKWDAQLSQIAFNLGIHSSILDRGVREYVFEVMRDYARRVIQYSLNLYTRDSQAPSADLTSKLHRLHFDDQLRVKVQRAAGVYTIHQRPEFRKAE
jgi:hypothetical protein